TFLSSTYIRTGLEEVNSHDGSYLTCTCIPANFILVSKSTLSIPLILSISNTDKNLFLTVKKNLSILPQPFGT
ncbi:MAG: hypothetical protein ACLKAM_10835, partial [Alkaliphilus sp.]